MPSEHGQPEDRPLNVREARRLCQIDPAKGREVTIKRNYAEWTGHVIGVVTRPALVLQTETGRAVIVLDGATYEEVKRV